PRRTQRKLASRAKGPREIAAPFDLSSAQCELRNAGFKNAGSGCVYCSPPETLLPHIALLPHMALLPHIALLPHMALLPHIALLPHMALLPHIALPPQRVLLAEAELPTDGELVPVTNCEVPHTAAFDHAAVVFHTADGLSVRYTVLLLAWKVAIGDMAVPLARSVLASAASTSM